MDNVTIPPEVVEAMAADIQRAFMRHGSISWLGLAEAAARALLKAWPGMVQDHGFHFDEADNAIILPLPQESSNG